MADLDADRVRGVGGSELTVPAARPGRLAPVVDVKVAFASIGVGDERDAVASRRGFCSACFMLPNVTVDCLACCV